MTLALANSICLWSYAGVPVSHGRILLALGITVGFGLVAWGMRGVTVTGALTGTILAFVITVAAGPGGFLTVLTVFVLTQFATRFGMHRKQTAGLAERKEGRRGSQVLSNLGVAGMTALPAVMSPRTAPLLLTAMTAALCEAAADTVSSEIGQAAGRRAYLITNLASVPAGVDGGITVTGTVAGIIAAFIVAWVALWVDVIPPGWWLMAALSGIAGMLFDSLLGATLQRPGRLGNNSVNFLSTVFAASLTLVCGVLLLA